MIISGYSDAEDIIAGINEAGIYQYIAKPWHPDKLLDTVRGAAQLFRLQKETETAGIDMKLTPERVQARGRREARRGAAAVRFRPHRARAGQPVARRRSTLAPPRRGLRHLGADHRRIRHRQGIAGARDPLRLRSRRDKAFVVENCGALPDELLESELFGCKKGAFTGAYQDRIGLFEVADGGTIFLDEIGETSPAFQVKLLRVLQEGEIRPLGAQRLRKVDVRVVAATNRDLDAEVRAGRFRRDLYYRLAAFPVHLPSLRERPMDIPLIAARSARRRQPRPSAARARHSTPETLMRMQCYDWPGNVRELQNEIQRMVVLGRRLAAGQDLVAADLAPAATPITLKSNGDGQSNGNGHGAATLKERVEALEKLMIAEALEPPRRQYQPRRRRARPVARRPAQQDRAATTSRRVVDDEA